MKSPILELGHSIGDAIRADAEAVCQRDPAMDTLLEVILFSKGYASLTCHRISYRLWHMGRKFTAYWLQSQTSATFGLDIHPCTQIGKAVMFDHGTGVVIGETAIVGDGCTILHGVTLGGTGKDSGDRHPKVGTHVLIGAGVSILGNITIGSFSKIGAGSVVLRPIPHHATAVGVPAKVRNCNAIASVCHFDTALYVSMAHHLILAFYFLWFCVHRLLVELPNPIRAMRSTTCWWKSIAIVRTKVPVPLEPR